jgi:hypothetical protein
MSTSSETAKRRHAHVREKQAWLATTTVATTAPVFFVRSSTSQQLADLPLRDLLLIFPRTPLSGSTV